MDGAGVAACVSGAEDSDSEGAVWNVPYLLFPSVGPDTVDRLVED